MGEWGRLRVATCQGGKLARTGVKGEVVRVRGRELRHNCHKILHESKLGNESEVPRADWLISDGVEQVLQSKGLSVAVLTTSCRDNYFHGCQKDGDHL